MEAVARPGKNGVQANSKSRMKLAVSSSCILEPVASLNPLTRELVFKLVFYGPGLGGKTTTLQYIHAATSPSTREDGLASRPPRIARSTSTFCRSACRASAG